jgi:hypothetical protein
MRTTASLLTAATLASGILLAPPAAASAAERECTSTQQIITKGEAKANVSLCAETDGKTVEARFRADCFLDRWYGWDKFDSCDLQIVGSWIYHDGKKLPAASGWNAAEYDGPGTYVIVADVRMRGTSHMGGGYVYGNARGELSYTVEFSEPKG